MQATSIEHNFTGCCQWFDQSHFDRKQQMCVAHMTLLIISMVGLALSIFLTLVSTGILWETYPLYALGHIAAFGSGIFLTLTAVSTIISLGIILQRYCRK